MSFVDLPSLGWEIAGAMGIYTITRNWLQDSKAVKEKKEKAYMPKLNSCPFAILIAAYLACGQDEENWRSVGLTKEELAKKGQKYTSTDMMNNVKPTAGANFGYTGVSCIRTLVEKGLMIKKGKAPVLH